MLELYKDRKTWKQSWKFVVREMTQLNFLAKQQPRASGIDEKNFKAMRGWCDQFMHYTGLLPKFNWQYVFLRLDYSFNQRDLRFD